MPYLYGVFEIPEYCKTEIGNFVIDSAIAEANKYEVKNHSKWFVSTVEIPRIFRESEIWYSLYLFRPGSEVYTVGVLMSESEVKAFFCGYCIGQHSAGGDQ